jgi:uncharacterized membrane protein YuzA (DUF378 family)
MCCNGKCWGGCWIHKIGTVLLLVGGLNWGLFGIGMLTSGNWNVVNLLLGKWPVVEAIVYILVGLSALSAIFGCKCKKCQAACSACCASGPEMKM